MAALDIFITAISPLAVQLQRTSTWYRLASDDIIEEDPVTFTSLLFSNFMKVPGNLSRQWRFHQCLFGIAVSYI